MLTTILAALDGINDQCNVHKGHSFVCVGVFTAQSTTRPCRAGQLIVALFLGRLRPSKRLNSTKRGRPRQ